LPGLFNVEQILLTEPKTLAEVLVHKSYEFEKPKQVREFLSLILGNGMIVVEGNVHKFQRKHVAPAFSFRHIKELIPIFWRKAVTLRDGVVAEMRENPEGDGRGVVEINHWATKVTMDIIGVAGLGREFNALKNSNDQLVHNYEEILDPTKEKLAFFLLNLIFSQQVISWLPWKLNTSLKNTSTTLRNICLGLVSDKRQLMKQESEAQLDILSLLINSNSFDDDMLVDQLLTFLAAG
jgi:cytochrome P450